MEFGPSSYVPKADVNLMLCDSRRDYALANKQLTQLGQQVLL